MNSSYDTNSKALLFSTSHFSAFGIGYKEAPAFIDIAGHWAKDDIEFVAVRGLLTGNNQFSPNTGMTRGMFVTALGRLAGINSTKYKNTKFTDVAVDAYYTPYMAWAAELGISSGTTATTFSPGKTITRQELASAPPPERRLPPHCTVMWSWPSTRQRPRALPPTTAA